MNATVGSVCCGCGLFDAIGVTVLQPDYVSGSIRVTFCAVRLARRHSLTAVLFCSDKVLAEVPVVLLQLLSGERVL